MPSLVGWNIDTNIDTTLNLYIDALALGDESKALAFVRRDPSSLGRSLEKRLKPRLQEAQEAGIIVDSKFLNFIIYRTEDQWAKKMLKEMRSLE